MPSDLSKERFAATAGTGTVIPGEYSGNEFVQRIMLHGVGVEQLRQIIREELGRLKDA